VCLAPLPLGYAFLHINAGRHQGPALQPPTMPSSAFLYDLPSPTISDSNIEKGSSSSWATDAKTRINNDNKVIATGDDVSRLIVDLRDDDHQALTFRSVFLGTMFAGLAAAISQVTSSI